MSNIVVTGAQWGDEGKGKIVDLLTEHADIIVRFQGGNNAGHTIIIGESKVIVHLIPSGILHPDKKCLIGNGVVLDPEIFLQEIDMLSGQGIDVSPARLMVSRKTHVIMPYHKLMDAARESAKSNDKKIGTTGRGIGPCYEDKMSRVGIRAGDLEDLELIRDKINRGLEEKNVLFERLYMMPAVDPEEVFESVSLAAKRLVPYLGDVPATLQDAGREGKVVLFEGAQGAQLDIDHGTYPFVTSSNTVAGEAALGCGCAPSRLDTVITVVKAYTTRVGRGPFPTELFDDVGEHMQVQGAEFGATTGRRRRCGWLDIVVLREAVRLCGPTGIALTKLDVLGGLSELKLCVGYTYRGQKIDYPPQGENGLAHVEPLYDTLPGWQEDIGGVTSWEALPRAAQNYITSIEELLGVPVTIVSVGPERSQTFFRG
ncbi:MAG: adenylosuccinate synthase [Thermodesulfobacteriota bacterium]|nr:adenylosuccinate synthase [Thermodesulfobacteriota bacterium]